MAWVGLRPSQLDDLDLPEQARLFLKATSRKTTELVDKDTLKGASSVRCARQIEALFCATPCFQFVNAVELLLDITCMWRRGLISI